MVFIQSKAELSAKLEELVNLDYVDVDQGGRRPKPYSLEEYSKQMEAEEATWLLSQASLGEKPTPAPSAGKGDESGAENGAEKGDEQGVENGAEKGGEKGEEFADPVLTARQPAAITSSTVGQKTL